MNSFKRPLYLSHGLICSYELWIVNSEDLAPAFVLANAGVDVWLGSFRGTDFSLGHAFLNSEEPGYWNFSWEQIATYDLSASVTYIHHMTNSKISVGGHSQGGLALIASLAEESLPINLIDKVFLIGPCGYMKYFEVNSVKYALKQGSHKLFSFFGFQKASFPRKYTRVIFVMVCHVFPAFCNLLTEETTDFNIANINLERMPYFAGKVPYTTSVKNIHHFAQLALNPKRKIFRFDYGEEENMQIYGTSEPKSYNLSNIQHPVYIFAGLGDRLSNITDIRDLHEDLPNSTLMEYEGLGHLGFIMGRDLSYLNDMTNIFFKN